MPGFSAPKTPMYAIVNICVAIHARFRSYACLAEDVPDEYGVCGAVVVGDHPPVADAQSEVLAVRQPPDIERAIIGAETIRSQDARTDRRIETPQLLL